MSRNGRRQKESESAAHLDRAVVAWRDAERRDEALSAEARDSILREYRRLQVSDTRPAPHASLFLPAARWALGAAVPILALSLLVGSVLLTQQPFRTGDLVVGAPRVEVSKSGGEVVFLIHNGAKTHKISKSTRPLSGETDETFTTQTGRFSDRLDSETEIVYYRID